MTATGQNTFNIPITVYLKKGLGFELQFNLMRLEHHLSFDGDGDWQAARLRLRSDVAERLGILER